ncbi:hypothetical protein IMSAGC004_00364 [Bacteroidaceae bacterium]|nr:hypothetical protein IMSAGC004_00364 [Bacteroidaceae bacterium]
MAHQSKYPSLDRQGHKMMFSFFEYLPMQYRQATEREWQIRKMIWSFKDGKSAGGTSYVFNKAQKKKLVIHNLF